MEEKTPTTSSPKKSHVEFDVPESSVTEEQAGSFKDYVVSKALFNQVWLLLTYQASIYCMCYPPSPHPIPPTLIV